MDVSRCSLFFLFVSGSTSLMQETAIRCEKISMERDVAELFLLKGCIMSEKSYIY